MNTLPTQLTTLRDEALNDWHPTNGFAAFAKQNALLAWNEAIAAAEAGRIAAAREALRDALVIAEREGAGWEENEALELLAAAAA